MSAASPSTQPGAEAHGHDHGHGHHGSGHVPAFFKPFVAIWAGFIGGIERVLPASNKSFAPYIAVFFVLMIFTGLTVGVAMADIYLGKYFPFLAGLFDDQISWIDLLVGMIIAAMKASFVLAFFMHLNHEASLVYRVMILTAVFFVAMLGLCWLAFDDKPPHKAPMVTPDPYTWKMSPETVAYLQKHHGEGKHGDAHGHAGDPHEGHGKEGQGHGSGPHEGKVGDAAGPGHEGEAHKPNAAAADGSRAAEGEAASVPGKHDRKAGDKEVHGNVDRMEPDGKLETPAPAGSP